MARALLLCLLLWCCCSFSTGGGQERNSAVVPTCSDRAVLALAHRRRPGSTKPAPSLAERLRRDEARRRRIAGRSAGRVAASSTYAPIPCGSAACGDLAGYYENGCTADALCGFALRYADNATTTGAYGADTLTLAPGSAGAAVVEGFRFGCAHELGGFDGGDETSGLIGLGDSPRSLLAQASPASGGAFSYCLPATTSSGGNSSSAGFLALGAPADTSGFAFTPMFPSDHIAVFYRVTLTGISVGGRLLDVPPSAFPHGDAGMILDSGTVLSQLPAAAYAALQAEFRRAMAAYPPAPPAADILDTCYNLTGFDNVTVPSVSLHFLGGVTIDLDVPNGILVEGCLAFVGLDPDDHGNGGIGNVNQRTFEVLYDPGHGRVGFRPRAC